MPNAPGNTLLDAYLAPHVIASDGTPSTQRPYINCGSGIDVADDPTFVDPMTGETVGATVLTASGGGGGSSAPIDFEIGPAGATSATDIDVDSKVWLVLVTITTPFNNGATLNLGQAGNASLLLTAFDLTVPANSYPVWMNIPWGSNALPTIASVTGGPTVGAAELLILQGPVNP